MIRLIKSLVEAEILCNAPFGQHFVPRLMKPITLVQFVLVLNFYPEF